jgi:DNA-binding LacI/PurR family transcriptional regulator
VAEAAGVSRATASRALNGGVSSPQARRAVKQAAARLGFFPNRSARTLARQRSDAVALVIPEVPDFIFHDPYLAIATSNLSSLFLKAGLMPMMAIVDPDDPARTVERFLRIGTVDGMIVMSFHDNPDVEQLLKSSGMPAVFIGRPPTPEAFPYVDVTNREGGYAATQHLLERGRRYVACLSGTLSLSSMVDRRDGYLAALADAGVEPGPILEGTVGAKTGQETTKRLLAECPELDAIFAMSDTLAAGALHALAEAGRAVPDDVAVVGFDNFATATEVLPNLTTVGQPVDKVTEAAAELLIGYLDTGEWGEHPRILPTELVVRDSS